MTTQTEVKTRPILFSAEMVRAILAGKKTQTRRLVDVPAGGVEPFMLEDGRILWRCCMMNAGYSKSKYGKIGDRLWVREAHQFERPEDIIIEGCAVASGGDTEVYYRADEDKGQTWRPSIHMPRWASRITLEITGVRVEKLGAITEADAVAEGCSAEWHKGADTPDFPSETDGYSAVTDYMALWEEINGKGSWEADRSKWVWVIEFKRVSP